jgi:hypothetical protein
VKEVAAQPLLFVLTVLSTWKRMEPFSIAPERTAAAGLIRFMVAEAGLRSLFAISGAKFAHARLENPEKWAGSFS